MKTFIFTLCIFLIFSCKEDSTNEVNPLVVSPDFLEIPYRGGLFSFSVNAQEEWHIKNTAAWCHLSAEDGINNADVTFEVDSNADVNNRYTHIYICTEHDTSMVMVSQLYIGSNLSGNGSSDSPYLIYAGYQLRALADSAARNVTSGKHYKLIANLSLANLNFKPIGTEDAPFYGTLDGDGFRVSDLLLTDKSLRHIGLFGYVDSCATIRNLNVSGNVQGSDFVGGICGYNRGQISDCHYNGSVQGSDYIGGLCGCSEGEVGLSSHNGLVSGGSKVGGICGYNYAAIRLCQASDSVSGNLYVGGISGQNFDTITHSSHNGHISCNGSYAGGICGQNGDSCLVSHSYHTGSVIGYNDGPDHIAGVCGYNNGILTYCYNTGTVSGYWTAGVCSQNTGIIHATYNTGQISGSQFCSGVCCINKDSLVNSYNLGDIAGKENFISGLCGQNTKDATIGNCYNTGNVTANGYRCGGITGTNEGTVQNCYNAGIMDIEGVYGGPLFGYNSGTFVNCHCSTNSAANDDSYNDGGVVQSCYLFSIDGILNDDATTQMLQNLNNYADNHPDYITWQNGNPYPNLEIGFTF